jgi:hypothetical protein
LNVHFFILKEKLPTKELSHFSKTLSIPPHPILILKKVPPSLWHRNCLGKQILCQTKIKIFGTGIAMPGKYRAKRMGEFFLRPIICNVIFIQIWSVLQVLIVANKRLIFQIIDISLQAF